MCSGQVSLVTCSIQQKLADQVDMGLMGKLFNPLAGVVHLEALELLSKECESKVWLQLVLVVLVIAILKLQSFSFFFPSPLLFSPPLHPPPPPLSSSSSPFPPQIRSRLSNLSEEEMQSLKGKLDKISDALKVEELPEGRIQMIIAKVCLGLTCRTCQSQHCNIKTVKFYPG